MTEPYYEIDIAQLAQMTGAADVTEMSSEFIITRISAQKAFSLFQYPVRLNAYAAIYCTQGYFDIDIDVSTFRVYKDTMLFYVPGSTMQIKESGKDDLLSGEAVLVASTREFLKGGYINFHGLFEKSLRLMSSPCITIDDEGKKIMADYYTLVSDLYKSSLEGTESAICSIGTSLMCLLGNLWKDELAKQLVSRSGQTRTQAKYEEFLALVSENFMTEKGVAFYAEKMCMTPKYLTTLVKNASGKTATQWIDAFLVLEAKNLLKYSDLTVKV
ncbi:MAG: helix-turn-helix domain-containing protein [Candidatus Cryptobacteroides sp.]